MSDSEFSLNTNPDDLLEIPGATALGDPPLTISGALADYANRPQPSGSSLSILMDDQQMRDAGVHPDQSGAAPDVPVIDATGAGDQKVDPAGGVAKAIGLTREAVTDAHNAASWLGRAPIISNALKTGKSASEAMTEAAKHPVVAGLNTLTRASIPPFFAAESVARGVNDFKNGPPDLDAIVGSAIRGMVVTGTSVVSPTLAGVANTHLPDGPAMGRAYRKSMADTNGRALLLP